MKKVLKYNTQSLLQSIFINLVSLCFCAFVPLCIIFLYPPSMMGKTLLKPEIKAPETITSIIFPASISWQNNILPEKNCTTVIDNFIYIITSNNTLVSINLQDGKTTILSDERFNNVKQISSYDSTLLLLGNKDFFSLSAKNFQFKKLLGFDSAIVDTKLINDSIIILMENAIATYNLTTNKYFSFSYDTELHFFSILPYDSDIIALTNDGKIIRYSYEGQIKWQLTLPTPITVHGVINKPVLYQPSGTYLYAIDVNNSHIKWKLLLGAESHLPPLISNNNIYITPLNNLLYRLDHKGNKKWIKLLDYRITTQILDINDELIVTPFSQEILSISKKSGNNINSFKTDTLYLIKMFFINESLILLYPDKIICLKKEIPKPEEVPAKEPDMQDAKSQNTVP
ncbi:MAG: hypothetical protein A2Y62_12645 [Candidatus Fischerbacteria bacterium RBG_13_37_8]|uniref:Pyrrolo-quinoline quinone repeat domain-containing protein n=1 Tax=Candidatus Fischerbacteria bacterium RBG_13_37_8 TaxID=1817863 RepID=A0A1F5VUU8_9BACT|nr:MAG: hypothetical protein A2Y62_12645 [Candidatus Fischerbacteria bacterium RBG_13_37_8]